MEHLLKTYRGEDTSKANKKQTVFSPGVRLWVLAVGAPARLQHQSGDRFTFTDFPENIAHLILQTDENMRPWQGTSKSKSQSIASRTPRKDYPSIQVSVSQIGAGNSILDRIDPFLVCRDIWNWSPALVNHLQFPFWNCL